MPGRKQFEFNPFDGDYKLRPSVRPPISAEPRIPFFPNYSPPVTRSRPNNGPSHSPPRSRSRSPRSRSPNSLRVHADTYTISGSNIDEYEESMDDLSGVTDEVDDAVYNGSRSPGLQFRLNTAKEQIRNLDRMKLLEEKVDAMDEEEERKALERDEKLNFMKERVPIGQIGTISRNTFQLIISAFIVGVLLATAVYTSYSHRTGFYQPPNLVDRMDNQFNNLKNDFPLQKEKFKVIRSAVKSIFGEPKQPAIVILVAASGAERMTSCFARVLANSIESIFDENKSFIHIKGDELSYRNPHVVKELLEKKAYNGFDNGSNVYLVENLNEIPSESIMIFHGLCDDNHAPFKKVVYLFTVNAIDFGLTTQFKEKDLKSFEVTKVWGKDIHENQLSSLESRIGAFKVLIEPEKNWLSVKKKLNC